MNKIQSVFDSIMDDFKQGKAPDRETIDIMSQYNDHLRNSVEALRESNLEKRIIVFGELYLGKDWDDIQKQMLVAEKRIKEQKG